MKYKKGYKYQLVEDFEYVLPIWFPAMNLELNSEFIDIKQNVLLIKSGYAWDGASCIPDIKNKVAALVHDALYQLIRQELLNKEKAKKSADILFMYMCRDEGTPKWISQIYYKSLEKFGDKAATKPREIYECW